MAGLGNNESNVIYVNLKGKKSGSEDPPYFVTSKKNAEGKWIVDQKFSRFEGYLIDVSIKTSTYKDEEYKNLVTKWNADGKIYQIEQSFNQAITRSMLNSFLSLDGTRMIAMNLYTNKNGYGSIWIEYGQDDPVKWAVDYEKIPVPTPIMNAKGQPAKDARGNELRDEEDRIEFFEKMTAKIKSNIEGWDLSSLKVDSGAQEEELMDEEPSVPQYEEPVFNEEADELPF